MGLGLDVAGGDVRGLRGAVVDACRRHGLLNPGGEAEEYVDALDLDVDLADDHVAVELYPDEGGISLDLSVLDDSDEASEQFARVLRDLVESVIAVGGAVTESDGGARVDPRRIGHLVP